MTTEHWITGSFLEPILQEKENDTSLRILSILIGPAKRCTSSYNSCKYEQISVTYSSKKRQGKISLLAKFMRGEEHRVDLLRRFQVFPKESDMLMRVLPKLMSIFKRGNDTMKLNGSAFYASASNEKAMATIIMEDEEQIGFVAANRTNGLNLEQCKVALMKLAKMHAASVVLQEEEDSFSGPYLCSPFSNERYPAFDRYYRKCLETLAIVISNWAGYEIYAEKLINLQDKISSKGRELASHEVDGFKVLNHGNFSIENILFKYTDDGTIEDVHLQDFSMSFWGSPAIDLLQFLYTTPSDEVRIYYQRELVQYYHRILKTTLEKINYNGYVMKLLDLHVAILKKEFYGVIMAFTKLPVVIMDSSDSVDEDVLLQECPESYRIHNMIFNNSKYHNIIKRLLIEFDQKGLLD